MYNKELEELMDAALTDGIVTAKERQILYKRAESMGIDLDEFEMVLDARIVKMKKEEAKSAIPFAKKSNKYGEIRKCPNCGFTLGGVVAKCPECGYEFTNVGSVSSAVKFFESIQKAIDEENNRSFTDTLKNALFSTGVDKVEIIIKTFPIPNSKEDLFEFIASLEPKTKEKFFYEEDDIEYADAFKQKYNECLNKAKALFPNDSLFAPFFEKKKKRFGLF